MTLQYRYLVVQQFMSGGKEIMDVIRWETMLHPRYLCLRETERKAECKNCTVCGVKLIGLQFVLATNYLQKQVINNFSFTELLF